MTQNYKNHVRYSVPYHFITLPLVLLGVGLAIYAFTQNPDLTHALIFFACVMIGISLGFARFFALKVQDRAARAEENLRYFMLTGKMLPNALRMDQILALRFASDVEYVALTERAIADGLSAKDIKKAVQNWRADHHRI